MSHSGRRKNLLLDKAHDRTAPQALSGQLLQCPIIIGIFCDVIHQLGIADDAVFINHDDSAGEQTFERAVGNQDTVVLAEPALRPERGERPDVLQSFRAAETALSEGQVPGDAEHQRPGHLGGKLIERPD